MEVGKRLVRNPKLFLLGAVIICGLIASSDLLTTSPRLEASTPSQVAPPEVVVTQNDFPTTTQIGNCAVTHQKIRTGPITIAGQIRESEIFKTFSTCVGLGDVEHVVVKVETVQCVQPTDLSARPKCVGGEEVSIRTK